MSEYPYRGERSPASYRSEQAKEEMFDAIRDFFKAAASVIEPFLEVAKREATAYLMGRKR